VDAGFHVVDIADGVHDMEQTVPAWLPARGAAAYSGASVPEEDAMRSVAAFIALVALAAAGPAAAQAWPDKPVRLVVPYPPGGNVDTAARLVAPGLQQALGQPFIIENKAGAGGMIAGEFVAKSAPDGYTLFFTANGPLLFSPLIFGRTPYQWDKSFAPISSVSFTPLVLQVYPSVQAKTLAELLALAKKEPGKLTMASPGAGTTNHLISELLQSTTGASWTTVHYKGNAPATTDLLAGRVEFNFDQVSVSLPYIKQGKVRALAVTATKRVPSLPDVPTFDEAGLKGMDAATFTGVLAPAGTPKEILARMSGALSKALQDKGVIEKFDAMGAEARGMTPEEFQAYLQREYDKWAPVIRRANIKAD
jgi:tripartite-type tricarboxylate transporter receptor subunit TctC